MLQRADPGGFDISNDASTLLAGGFINDGSFVGVSSGAPAGRSNTKAYQTSLTGAYFGYFTANFQESVFGWAWHCPFSSFTNGERLFALTDGTSQQIDGRTDGTGHIYFTRNGTTIGSPSAAALTVGWYYFEVKAFIAGGTSGACELRVTPLGSAPSNWITLTGVNTQATGNAYANRFYVISPGAGFQYWKDLYILDTGTGLRTDYLGDITVKILYPASADGTFQQWTPNTGTQVAAVQEHTGTFPDGDTTYISDTVSGHISAFGMDALSASTIYGVIHASYARTASSGTINQVLVQSGSVVETSATWTLTTSYLWYQDSLEQNPVGPADWSAASVNGTHPGVKIQATSLSARVSQEFLLAILSNAVAPFRQQPNICVIC